VTVLDCGFTGLWQRAMF